MECPTCEKEENAHGEAFETETAVRRHHKAAHGESLSVEEAECLNCSETFEYNPNWEGEVKFCSMDCQNEARRSGVWNPNSGLTTEKSTCRWCGEGFEFESRHNRSLCSEKCRREWLSWYRSKQVGEDNHQWKGGYTDVDRGENWRLIRREALKRDDYSCQNCGVKHSETENWLTVHHIKPFRLFEKEEEANRMDNLITLCPTCHGKVEQEVIDCPEVS